MTRNAFIRIGFVTLLLSMAIAPTLPASPPISDEQIAQVCNNGPTTQIAANRMPVIPADKLTEAQKQTVSEFATTRSSEVYGPSIALLRSPEVGLHILRLGNYLQYKSVLQPKLRQFIIVITARQWSQQYIWSAHCPSVLKAGLNPDIARAVADGRRPTGMSEDEEIVYDFIDELHRNQSVSDITYAKALNKFGEQGVIDMTGLNGLYAFFAMVANVTRMPLRPDTTASLPVFPH